MFHAFAIVIPAPSRTKVDVIAGRSALDGFVDE
jgi:hypothetical protein